MTTEYVTPENLFHTSDPSESWVQAQYRNNSELDPFHHYNPLIATLPPLMSPEEATDRLAFQFKYDESERLGSREERCIRASKLYLHRQPLSFYYEFYLTFYMLLLNGYAPRNPFMDLAQKQLQSGCNKVDDVVEQMAINTFPDISLVTSILGESGVGKTCLGKQVTQPFPQVYKHCVYEGRPFEQAQISWLRLECPTLGSVSTLEMEFFQEIDRLLGTNYYVRMMGQRLPSERLLLEIKELCKRYKVGALVIDEIQRLFLMIKDIENGDEVKQGDSSSKKTRDPRKLLEFLIRMSNTINIPLVFIGTGNMDHIFPSSLPLARRFSQAGSPTIRRLMKDSVDWTLFLDSLERYQYTAEKFELTDDIRDAFYEETQGIIGPGVSLYIFLQMEAIWSGKETFDAKTVHSVAKVHLKPWQTALQIYRSGLENKIVMPEVKSVEPEFAGFLARRQGRLYVEDAEKKTEGKSTEEKVVSSIAIITKVLKGKCAPDEAIEIANIVLHKFSGTDQIYDAIDYALQLVKQDQDQEESFEQDGSETTDSQVNKAQSKSSEDVREIAIRGRKNESRYKKLLRSGLIQTPSDS